MAAINAAVTPKSNRQLQQLYLDPRFRQLKELFIDVILGRLMFRESPRTASILARAVEGLVSRRLSDFDIYSRLHTLVHTALFKSAEYNRQKKNQKYSREDKRIVQLRPIFRELKLRDVNSYLDVGSGDGSITLAIGELLNADRILACDVVKPESVPRGIEFTLLNPKNPYVLPYPNSSQDVITAFMSLHHIEGINMMLREIRRVLKDDGIFIIREHDSSPPELSLLLDVMHGFYAMVWSEKKEMKDFRTHYSHYYTQDEMKQLIVGMGFTNVYQGIPKGAWRHYYAAFKKE